MFFLVTSKRLQLSRLLTSLEAASVFCCVAWEVEVPISLQGGGKGISQVKESALSWGVSVKTLFIPWPYSILPIWPTWYVSFWILRARLVWAESKKGLFSYPKRNLDLSGWWFFPPNQRDSAVLLEPFFAWHFFCMAKTGWDWQRPHQGSFDATSAFDALLLLMAKTCDAFPKHGVSRSCIRSLIGTSARTGSFYFRMGAAIPSCSAVLWGHGFSFLGLTP